MWGEPACSGRPTALVTRGPAAGPRQNGGPQAGVFALPQTPDGDLWVGTEFGLFHFDGARFLPWQPPQGPQLTGEYISALAASADGSLWIGAKQGLLHWNGNRVENYQTSKGPTGPRVASIVVDRAGSVWSGTVGYRSGGLCRVEENSLRCYKTEDGLRSPGILSLHEDRLGRLWAGGASGLSRIEPTNPGGHPLTGIPGRIVSIADDRTRQIWIADGSENGLKRLQDGKLEQYSISSAESKIRPVVLLPDRDDGLWIGTAGQGLLHLHDGRLDRFSRADGLSGDHIRGLIEDREGSVWAATEAGLDRFRDLPVTTISKRQGLPQNAVVSVFASG